MIFRDVSVTDFKAQCTSMLRDVSEGKYSVRVQKRGRTVAVVERPRSERRRGSWVGSMQGTVLRYDNPFDPAVPPESWETH